MITKLDNGLAIAVFPSEVRISANENSERFAVILRRRPAFSDENGLQLVDQKRADLGIVEAGHESDERAPRGRRRRITAKRSLFSFALIRTSLGNTAIANPLSSFVIIS